jgi:hypothetical protein
MPAKPQFTSVSEPIQRGRNLKIVWRTASVVQRERTFGDTELANKRTNIGYGKLVRNTYLDMLPEEIGPNYPFNISVILYLLTMNVYIF